MAIVLSYNDSICDWVYTAISKVKDIISKQRTIVQNLDVIRSIFTVCASSEGLRCEIEVIKDDDSKHTNKWSIFFTNSAGLTCLVATALESGTSKRDIPLLCPICGNPNIENVPGTNAHNVVSASIWRAVFDEISSYFPSEYKANKKFIEFLNSLKKIGESTSRETYCGAATQGDRRTCKSCEQLHGGLSLLQREKIMREVSLLPLEPYCEPDGKGKRHVVGYLHYFCSESAIGAEFNVESSIQHEILVEITKQRIEDVVRGVALEIRNEKYKEYDSGKAKIKEEYSFMELFNESGFYYGFLQLIRDKAFSKASGKSTDGHVSYFMERVKRVDFISKKS